MLITRFSKFNFTNRTTSNQIKLTHGHLYKAQKTKSQHKNATKNFDYTKIADRLRTVIWNVDTKLM